MATRRVPIFAAVLTMEGSMGGSAFTSASDAVAWSHTDELAERAQCFKDYVNACLDNPSYVGCHWFQYTDQAMTGRYFDGEAYQVGFVSVCDVPYPELVEACRETAAQMYSRHFDTAH